MSFLTPIQEAFGAPSELDFTHFKRHDRWYRVAGSFCTSELAVDSEKPSDTNHQWLRTKVMSSITFPSELRSSMVRL